MNDSKILLKIAGINILISTSEDEVYARSLAEDIDTDVRGILEGNPSASVTNAALLCAIDYLDAYRKANRSTNNLRNQIKEYLSDAANAKLQFDEECKKTAELTVEIQALRDHLTRIASEGDSSGAVEHLKADLAKSTNEINKLKKQLADLIGERNGLLDKSAAMSDYISNQDKEIARLNSVIAIHLESIKKLEDNLRAKDAEIGRLSALPDPAAKPAPLNLGEPLIKDEPAIIEKAQEEVKAVIDNLNSKQSEQKKSQPTFEEVEDSIFDAEKEIDFSLPEEENADEEELGEIIEDKAIEKIFEEPKPPVILDDKPTDFAAFDIDLDDKPDEYFKGSPKKNTADGDMPNLNWTKEI